MINKIAKNIDIAPPGEGFKGPGRLGLEGVPLSSSASIIFAELLSKTIGVLTIVAFLWFTFKLLSGAIAIISSGSDKAKYEEARGNISYGLIGLVIVVAGIFILDLVGAFLDIDFLDITNAIQNLGLL